MLKTALSFCRTLLFLFGLALILLAYVLLGASAEKTPAMIYMWCVIPIMYLILFCPLFFSHITTKNFSGKIPTFPVVWISIITFLATSLVLILLVQKQILNYKYGILFHAVMLFLFFINVYFAYFSSEHIHSVAAQESQISNQLDAIKKLIRVVDLKAANLPDSFDVCKKMLSKIADEVQYLSPINSSEAAKQENRILTAISNADAACELITSGSTSTELFTICTDIQNLVMQRKLLIN